MEDSQVAAALSAQLEQRIGRQRYELWFTTQAQLCAHSTCLIVRAASPFVRDWLRKHFADEIRACWEAIVGEAGLVEFDSGAMITQSRPCTSARAAHDNHAAANDNATIPAAEGGSKSHICRREKAEDSVSCPPSAPLPVHIGEENGHHYHAKATRAANNAAATQVATRCAYDLAAFVVGAGNEYAFRAAQLTGRGRQQASPLVFCGPTGVGKTHLLRAILREYRRHRSQAAAVYLSAEQFTTSFVEALRGSGMPSFRQKCRGARLLAIDDLQFFAGKRRTLEELLHTFDTMAADGRQLVLASDRGLSDLRPLGNELVSRLAGGLICEIEPPDYATRLGILRRMRDEMGLSADDAVLSIVAQQITEGARELRGALHRLEATSHAYGEPISRDLAQRALADLARHSTRAVRLADVQKAVCEVFGIEPTQLRSERKGRCISEPRMLAMWLARRYTRAPWSEIGEFFGRRSHSTVISAHRRVEKLIAQNAQIGMADRTCNVEDAIRRVETVLRTA
ncbi:MAG TPA: chromosomal replication initiator protein DnaA [Lacipirellulaceae bacterium]|nr:chromosomal replication initiator protein DnaA [Lacipirellulaceae bacterium]